MRYCSCRQQGHADSKTLLQQNPPVLNWGCQLTQVVLYNGRKTVVIVVVFGRPLVKRFVLCYRTIVCPVLFVLSVTLVYCGQTIGWIKMKLGMQVGLGPGHMGTQLPLPNKGAEPPIFGTCLLWPNACIDQDGTWHRGGRRSMGTQLPSPKRGQSPSPNFRPISIVAKRLYVSGYHLVWR